MFLEALDQLQLATKNLDEVITDNLKIITGHVMAACYSELHVCEVGKLSISMICETAILK